MGAFQDTRCALGGVKDQHLAVFGSGACGLEGGNIAGVLAELYGDQVDRLVKAAIFVCVTLELEKGTYDIRRVDEDSEEYIKRDLQLNSDYTWQVRLSDLST